MIMSRNFFEKCQAHYRHMGPIIITSSTTNPSFPPPPSAFLLILCSPFFLLLISISLKFLLSLDFSLSFFKKTLKDLFLSLFAIKLLFVLMEGAPLGGSSGGSSDESTVSKVDVGEQEWYVEATSYPSESKLELGLGLSLGVGGCGGGKVKASAWGECGRILTAKDFPLMISPAHRGPNSSSASSGVAVSGTKRAADSSPQEGGSPSAGRFDY